MLAAPIPIGPFLVDETGRLTVRVTGLKPGFSFVWRGRQFAALLAGGHVSATCMIARVPSTAHFASRRDAAFAAWRAMPRTLPEGWTLRLTPDHCVQVEMQETMNWPASAPALMLPLVRMLLQLAPYLDALEEIGFGLDERPAGRSA